MSVLTLVKSQSGQLPGMTPQQRVYTVANPVAGADYAMLVPAGETWFVQSFKCTLLASGTVATRVPLLELAVAGSLAYIAPATRGTTANGGDVYTWAPQMPAITTSNVVAQPLPDIPLQAGSSLITSTQSIQAGDQYTTGVLNVLAYT